MAIPIYNPTRKGRTFFTSGIPAGCFFYSWLRSTAAWDKVSKKTGTKYLFVTRKIPASFLASMASFPLCHDLLEIAQAQRISKVTANAQDDDYAAIDIEHRGREL
jgi:hypothetical protein